MTFNKTVDNVTEGKWYYEMFWPNVSSTEKRPFLFPFFTSLMHSVFGYRVENVFILNYFVLWASLFLLYLLIRFYLGELLAFSSLVLVLSQPIISLSATSASFELFNLLFIIASFLSLRYFLSSPDSKSCTVLILNLIMLANVRYESAIFFVIIMLIVLIAGYLKPKFLTQSVVYGLSSLYFLPLIWQRIIMLTIPDPNVKGGSWLNYFNWKNLLHNTDIFVKSSLGFNNQLGYAGTLNILGFLALLFCIVLLMARLKESKNEDQNIFLACVIAGILASFFIVNLYGADPHPMNGRFYLPELVVFSILPIFSLINILKSTNKLAVFIFIGALCFFAYYHPVAVEDRLTNNLMIVREFKFVDGFLKKYADKNALIICGRPGQIIVFNHGAISYASANHDVSTILQQYKNHLFSSIYVIQSISYTTKSPLADNVLNPRYQLETVDELQITGAYFFRISKVQNPNS